MELAKPPASNDKDKGQETIRDLTAKESRAKLTQSKKGEDLVAMLQTNRKRFDIMGDEIMQVNTKNTKLKKKKDITTKNG